MIRLGVNIDHIATLREVRKATYPDILEAARVCKKAGADQITVHLREDRRHIQDADVIRLLKHQALPVNLEMAFTPEMVSLAKKWRPYSVTLVPERRAEMTTESGLDLKLILARKNLLKEISGKIKIFGFIDPDPKQVKLAAALKFDGIEFHTGPFAHAFGKTAKSLKTEVKKLNAAAELADRLGLEVKAGHGLTLENVRHLSKMKNLCELNIGHSIVSRAVIVGLEKAVSEMKIKLAKR